MKNIWNAPTAGVLTLALTGLILLTMLKIVYARESDQHAITTPHWSTAGNLYSLDSITRILRLKLYVDKDNYDDIVIAFNSGASPAYNFNEDSRYMPGIGADEGLASYSSDGVELSVNFLPLPKQATEAIRLDVEAKNSGTVTLKRTELDSLPDNYSLWLVDKYKKDSVNLRVDSNYVFNINKADTASFGSYRFSVVVSQEPVAAFKLIAFNAIKAVQGAQLSWSTQNEENHTHFNVERSTDEGTTFETIDSLTSTSAGTYSYTDKTPPSASDEYRLKITASNGIVSYSNKIILLYSKTINMISGNLGIYPNPASDMLNLTINQNNNNIPGYAPALQSAGLFPSLASQPATFGTVYNIKIISITGLIVKTAISSSGNWQNNISSLRPGTYIIQVVDNKNSSIVGRGTFIKM